MLKVDPEAKRAAVDKIDEAFDLDLNGPFAEEPGPSAFTMSFTVEQLEAMLAEAKRKEAITPCGPSPDTLDPIPACSR